MIDLSYNLLVANIYSLDYPTKDICIYSHDLTRNTFSIHFLKVKYIKCTKLTLKDKVTIATQTGAKDLKQEE